MNSTPRPRTVPVANRAASLDKLDPVHAFAYRPDAKTGLLTDSHSKANDIARLANLLETIRTLQKRTGELCAALAVPLGMASADSTVAAGKSRPVGSPGGVAEGS